MKEKLVRLSDMKALVKIVGGSYDAVPSVKMISVANSASDLKKARKMWLDGYVKEEYGEDDFDEFIKDEDCGIVIMKNDETTFSFEDINRNNSYLVTLSIVKL